MMDPWSATPVDDFLAWVLAWAPNVLAVGVVVLAAPISWAVALLAWRTSRADPEGGAARTSAWGWTCWAIIVTVLAAIFVNNGVVPPVLNVRDTQLITRLPVLVLTVFAGIYWLVWYFRNGNGR